jgi:hypothetical protein
MLLFRLEYKKMEHQICLCCLLNSEKVVECLICFCMHAVDLETENYYRKKFGFYPIKEINNGY